MKFILFPSCSRINMNMIFMKLMKIFFFKLCKIVKNISVDQ